MRKPKEADLQVHTLQTVSAKVIGVDGKVKEDLGVIGVFDSHPQKRGLLSRLFSRSN